MDSTIFYLRYRVARHASCPEAWVAEQGRGHLRDLCDVGLVHTVMKSGPVSVSPHFHHTGALITDIIQG